MRRHFLGEIGISYSDYIRMSFGQLQAASEGYTLRRSHEDSNFRTLTWYFLNAFGDSKKLPLSMQQWWKLPTDQIIQEERKKKRGKRVSSEQWAAFLSKMKPGKA